MGCERAVATFPGTPAIALPRSEYAKYRRLSVTTAPSLASISRSWSVSERITSLRYSLTNAAMSPASSSAALPLRPDNRSSLVLEQISTECHRRPLAVWTDTTSKHSSSVSLPDTRVIPAAEFRPGVSFQFAPENSRANSPGRYVRARFSIEKLYRG